MNKTILIKGEGKISIIPDYVILNLDLISVNKNYNIAVNESKMKYNSLLNSLNSIGLKNEDLKTNNFYIETIYENKELNSNYDKIFAGYKVLHQLNIGIYLDMDYLNKLIGAITSSVANPNLKIKFTVKNQKEFLDILLKNTITDARNNATTISESLGLILKEIVNINYTQKNFQIYSTTEIAPRIINNSFNITPNNIELNDYIEITWIIDSIKNIE